MIDIASRLYTALANPVAINIRDSKKLYPSSASIKTPNKTYGACLRQEYYRWFNTPPDNSDSDPDLTLILMSGNILHEGIVQLLRENTAKTDIDIVSVEQSFYNEKYKISGRIDFLCFDRRTKKLVGCDIKTVGEGVTIKVVDWPKESHILQCIVYLKEFNDLIDDDFLKVESWNLLYFARSDSFKLRKNPHGSLFSHLWQFEIKLHPEKDYVIVTSQRGDVKEYPDLTIEKVYERYQELLNYIDKQELPPRDYEYNYSIEKLVGMSERGLLNKTETTKVKNWLKKGGDEKKFPLDKGDFECRYCAYAERCYSDNPEPTSGSYASLVSLSTGEYVPEISDQNIDQPYII